MLQLTNSNNVLLQVKDCINRKISWLYMNSHSLIVLFNTESNKEVKVSWALFFYPFLFHLIVSIFFLLFLSS